MDTSNTNFNQNSARIYTGSAGGELYISTSNSKQTISASNNRSQYYAELAKKYRDETKTLRDDTKYYAEQNTDVTVEFVNNVKAELLRKIDTKQDSGDFALKTDLPTNISELENDSQYVTNDTLVSTLDVFLPNQENNTNKFLMTDGTDLSWQSLNGFSLFDTILKDHILTYEESKGLALQGTYVYKEAIAGSRYGYPDFYAKCLEEKEAATATETTLGDSTITMYVNSNGHQFYDIADKDSIDNWFNTYGSAWFYGVDEENKRIFLPRNSYYAINGIADNIPVVGDGNILGLSLNNGVTEYAGITRAQTSGDYSTVIYVNSTDHRTSPIPDTPVPSGTSVTSGGYIGNIGYGDGGLFGVTTEAGYSGLIADSSNTIKFDENKYLYICVGNTTNYEGMTSVVNQGLEILEQVAQKVNVDGTNLNSEGKSLIASYTMPSDNYVDLEGGVEMTKYVAPANGWFAVGGTTGATNGMVGWSSSVMSSYSWESSNTTQGVAAYIPVKKGETVTLRVISATVKTLRFIYAEGEE